MPPRCCGRSKNAGGLSVYGSPSRPARRPSGRESDKVLAEVLKLLNTNGDAEAAHRGSHRQCRRRRGEPEAFEGTRETPSRPGWSSSGIKPDAATRSSGDCKPVADNGSEAGRAKNPPGRVGEAATSQPAVSLRHAGSCGLPSRRKLGVSSHSPARATVAYAAPAWPCGAWPCAACRRAAAERPRPANTRRGPDAEHAFDAADHAADRGADDRADRSGDPVAFMEPVRGAARDTLGLRGQRSRDQREDYAREYCSSFHCFSFVAWRAGRLAANKAVR